MLTVKKTFSNKPQHIIKTKLAKILSKAFFSIIEEKKKKKKS